MYILLLNKNNMFNFPKESPYHIPDGYEFSHIGSPKDDQWWYCAETISWKLAKHGKNKKSVLIIQVATKDKSTDNPVVITPTKVEVAGYWYNISTHPNCPKTKEDQLRESKLQKEKEDKKCLLQKKLKELQKELKKLQK